MADFIKKGFFVCQYQVVDNDLQNVEILMRLSKSKLLSRFLKLGFSVDKLKSSNKIKFSYEEVKSFRELESFI